MRGGLVKSFYTFISRVLLIVFTANCLVPSAAWAQRVAGPPYAPSKVNGAQWPSKDGFSLDGFFDVDGKSAKETQPRPAGWGVKKPEVFFEELQKNIQQRVIQSADNLEVLWEKYNNSFTSNDIILALNDIYAAAQDIPDIETLLSSGRSGQVPPIWLTAAQEDFLNYLPRIDSLEKLIEFTDPILGTYNPQQRSYAAQVLATTLNSIMAEDEAVSDPQYNPAFTALLKRMQLRLLHQAGGYVPAQPLQTFSQDGKKALALVKDPNWKTYPEVMAEVSLRNWTRLCLLRVHKYYKILRVPDPLGDAYIGRLRYRFNQELEWALKNKKQAPLLAMGIFVVILALEDGTDVKQAIGKFETPRGRKNFLDENNEPISQMFDVLKMIILDDPTSEQGKKLFNDLVTMATDRSFSLFTNVEAMQVLADMRKKCNGQCAFTDEIESRLSCRAAELYGPLVSMNYDNYGLDVSQMLELSNALRDLYTAFNGPKRFLDWKKGEIPGILGIKYFNGSPMFETDMEFFHRFESREDVLLADMAEKLAKKEAWKARRCNGSEITMFAKPYRNLYKEGNDLNKEILVFVAEMITFDVAFRLAAPVFRTVWGVVVRPIPTTVRGVVVSTPQAVSRGWKPIKDLGGVKGVVREVKAGKGLGNVKNALAKGGAEAKNVYAKGIEVSKVKGHLKAGERAGIQLQAVKVAKDGSREVRNINSYRKLVNLRGKNLEQIAFTRNGVEEAVLDAGKLKEFSALKKVDTWEFLTNPANLEFRVSEPLSLKALQGSPFRFANKALREARQSFIRTQAVRDMAKSGNFDMWLGLRKAGTEAKAGQKALEDYNWIRAAEADVTDLGKALSLENLGNVEVALTPRYMLQKELMPKYFWYIERGPSAKEVLGMLGKQLPKRASKEALTLGKGTRVAADAGKWTTGSFESTAEKVVTPMKAYVAGPEKIELLRDLVAVPQNFGIFDRNTIAIIKNMGAGKTVSLAGKMKTGLMPQKHEFGKWAGSATRFLEKTGQGSLPFKYIFARKTQLRDMWESMGHLFVGWSGFVAADVASYDLGLQNWFINAQQKEMDRFAASLPEGNAAKNMAEKEAAEQETVPAEAAQTEQAPSANIYNRILASAEPQKQGTLFSVPIIMARRALSGIRKDDIPFVPDFVENFANGVWTFIGADLPSFVPQGVQEWSRYEESSLKYNNAMVFSKMYWDFNNMLVEASNADPTGEIFTLALQYCLELESIKDSPMTFTEKNARVQQLALNWGAALAKKRAASAAKPTAEPVAAPKEQEPAQEGNNSNGVQSVQAYNEVREQTEGVLAMAAEWNVLSPEETADFRRQIKQAEGQPSDEERLQDMYRIYRSAYEQVFYRYYGEETVDSLVASAAKNNYVRNDFKDIIIAYEQQVKNLVRNTADIEEFNAARAQFTKKMQDRVDTLQADPKHFVARQHRAMKKEEIDDRAF